MAWKIPRVLRKLRGGFTCLYENGWSYTWYHGLSKVGKYLCACGARNLPYREVRRKIGAKNEFAPVRFVRPPTSDASRTLALFAMYSPDGRVPESTWMYLRGLREVADEIIVHSDCAICGADAEKMRSVVSCAVFERHGEYDFGSLKRAYRIARENGYLRGCERLIMANDSCLGPIFPLSRMMEAMLKRPCDFWGQTSYSFHGRPHVQSYFVVFSRRVVETGALGDFFDSLPACQSRAEVISSCEIAMSEFLARKGFKWDSYVPYRALLKNPTCSPCALIGKYACPLVKIKALAGETFEPLEQVHRCVKAASPAAYDAFTEISDDWEVVPGI